jgi:hypothetical protein
MMRCYSSIKKNDTAVDRKMDEIVDHHFEQNKPNSKNIL